VLRVMSALVRASLMTGMQYRSDFIFGFLTGIPRTAATLAPLFIVFSHRDEIAGWNLNSAMLVMALFLLLKTLNEGFMEPNLGEVVEAIRHGTLDLVLMKPADAQLLVSVRRMDPSRAWDLLAAVAVGAWALLQMPAPSPLDALMAVLMVVSGLASMYGLWILAICTSFFFVRVDNLRFLVTSASGAGRWPINVFGGWVRWILTVIVPVAVVTTFPAMAVSGNWHWSTMILGLCTGVGFVILSRIAWLKALGAYTSASS
jgi:ABC-2 type transport system permease protein